MAPDRVQSGVFRPRRFKLNLNPCLYSACSDLVSCKRERITENGDEPLGFASRLRKKVFRRQEKRLAQGQNGAEPRETSGENEIDWSNPK